MSIIHQVTSNNKLYNVYIKHYIKLLPKIGTNNYFINTRILYLQMIESTYNFRK